MFAFATQQDVATWQLTIQYVFNKKSTCTTVRVTQAFAHVCNLYIELKPV